MCKSFNVAFGQLYDTYVVNRSRTPSRKITRILSSFLLRILLRREQSISFQSNCTRDPMFEMINIRMLGKHMHICEKFFSLYKMVAKFPGFLEEFLPLF